MKKEREAKAEERKENEEFRNKYLRALADLDNYRKRAALEKDELSKFSNESLVKELLPAVDSLAKAMDFSDKGPSEELHKGLRLVKKQIEDALAKFGVSAVESIGKKYDPNFHEALMMRDTDGEPGLVIAEMQKGYTMHGRLIRPAMVIVSKKSEKS